MDALLPTKFELAEDWEAIAGFVDAVRIRKSLAQRFAPRVFGEADIYPVDLTSDQVTVLFVL